MLDKLQAELNEMLNKLAQYENLVNLMDEQPPKNPDDKEIAETLHQAYDVATDILMKMDRKINNHTKE